MIDIDECVMLEFRQVIFKVLDVFQCGVIYSIVCCNYFFGCFMCYSGWYFDCVLCLYECVCYCYNDNLVYELLDSLGVEVILLIGDFLYLICCDFVGFQ